MKKYIKLYEEFVKPSYIYDDEGFIVDIDEAKKWLFENVTVKAELLDDDSDYRRIIEMDEYYDNISVDETSTKLKFNIHSDCEIRNKPIDRCRVRLGNSMNFNLCDCPNVYSFIGMPENVDFWGISSCPNIITLEYMPDALNDADVSDMDGLISFKPMWEYEEEEKLKGNLIERTLRFIHWLPKSPNKKNSLDWIKEHNPEIYEYLGDDGGYGSKLIEYAMENNLDIGLSDNVKNIASTALKGNHKLR